MIDYINFKGEGLYLSESYNSTSWGLLQVLQGMNAKKRGPVVLQSFVNSADKVLTKRVSNAPKGKNESRWLPGWRKRLKTYL